MASRLPATANTPIVPLQTPPNLPPAVQVRVGTRKETAPSEAVPENHLMKRPRTGREGDRVQQRCQVTSNRGTMLPAFYLRDRGRNHVPMAQREQDCPRHRPGQQRVDGTSGRGTETLMRPLCPSLPPRHCPPTSSASSPNPPAFKCQISKNR